MHAFWGADVDTIHPMTAAQVVIVVAGTLLLLTLMYKVGIGAIERERRYMERRHAEWIAGGSKPEEKPNFFTGSGGDSGGSF